MYAWTADEFIGINRDWFVCHGSGEVTGSDIVLEAVLEAEVARNAKEFFSQPQNEIKFEWFGKLFSTCLYARSSYARFLEKLLYYSY